MATKWTLREKVLSIVDEQAHVIDAQIGTGPMTLTKLHSRLDRIFLCGAELESYVQYPGSDCRNGGLIRVKDGHQLVERLYSHHVSIIQGNHNDELRMVAQLLGLILDPC